ncbi:MAG: secondary thiamine-phosphate synthase enzyme YjbQ, partial [Spirochaetaceae bacterium]|nr:secondary thiamine-phosphate synthase enzyme YjbQ [Spirochaetaceae bacterium]
IVMETGQWTITIHSEGTYYSENVTTQVQDAVRKSGISNGLVTVFLQHTTGALMLLEYEIGVLADLQEVLENVIGDRKDFYHHVRDVDRNGKAHVLNAMLNSSLVLPFSDGRLCLGEYQDVVFLDFQPLRRERQIVVHVCGK